MFKRTALLLAFVLSCVFAHAQTTQITASHIQVFGGSAVTGQFCVTPTIGGVPISITTTTGQQLSPVTPLCFPIVNGVLSNTAIVPDVSQSQPANFCYLTTIYNNAKQLLGSYPCIQPQGTTWSFDGFVPGTLPNGSQVALPQFLTNGVANPAQGTLNFVGPGVSYGAGGVINIASGAGVVPSVLASNVVTGTDAFAAITAALAALPGGKGVVDARGLGTATYAVTSQLSIPARTTVLLSPGTVFTLNQTLGTTKSPSNCAVTVGDGSALVTQANNSLTSSNFQLGSGFTGWGGVCNADFTGNQESLLIDGVHVQGNATETVGGALMYIAGVFAPTQINNSGTRFCYAQCFALIAGTTGSGGAAISDIALYNDIFQDGYGGATSYPGSVVLIDTLTYSSAAANINFYGGMIQLNGPHNSLLIINGESGVQADSVGFFGTTFQGAAATVSVANPNVDPIQLIDVSSVYFSNLRYAGTHGAGQVNLVDISTTQTSSFPNAFGININQIATYSGYFTCLVNNTAEGSCDAGFATGSDGLVAMPNYSYGQVFPQIRQTNVAPPSAACNAMTIGSIWTNSAAADSSAQLCEMVNGTPTWSKMLTANHAGQQSITSGPQVNYLDDFFSQDFVSQSIGSPTGQSCALNNSTTFLGSTSSGIMALTSGTVSAAGSACLLTGNTTGGVIANPATAPIWTWESRVMAPVLPGTTAGSYQAGFGHFGTASSPFASGIEFYLSSANSVANDWYCRYNTTQTDTGVAAVANTWARLSIKNDGTTLHWYINGAEVAACAVPISSLPTSSLAMAWSSVAGSTTSVLFGVDYVNFQMNVTR